MSASELAGALCDLHDTRSHRRAQTSPAFDRRLAELRQWQSRRIAAWHRPLAQDHGGEALLDFLTHSFYLDADWSELTAKPDAVAARIGRIISDDRPLVIAVRLQQSADRLDTALANILNARIGAAPITPRAYVGAFRAVGQLSTRRQQIDWIADLVDLLAGYAANRPAYWAFKLAGSPAKALGLGRTYALLAEGFAAMRSTRNLKHAAHEAMADQHRLLDRLLA